MKRLFLSSFLFISGLASASSSNSLFSDVPSHLKQVNVNYSCNFGTSPHAGGVNLIVKDNTVQALAYASGYFSLTSYSLDMTKGVSTTTEKDILGTTVTTTVDLGASVAEEFKTALTGVKDAVKSCTEGVSIGNGEVLNAHPDLKELLDYLEVVVERANNSN